MSLSNFLILTVHTINSYKNMLKTVIPYGFFGGGGGLQWLFLVKGTYAFICFCVGIWLFNCPINNLVK